MSDYNGSLAYFQLGVNALCLLVHLITVGKETTAAVELQVGPMLVYVLPFLALTVANVVTVLSDASWWPQLLLDFAGYLFVLLATHQVVTRLVRLVNCFLCFIFVCMVFGAVMRDQLSDDVAAIGSGPRLVKITECIMMFQVFQMMIGQRIKDPTISITNSNGIVNVLTVNPNVNIPAAISSVLNNTTPLQSTVTSSNIDSRSHSSHSSGSDHAKDNSSRSNSSLASFVHLHQQHQRSQSFQYQGGPGGDIHLTISPPPSATSASTSSGSSNGPLISHMGSQPMNVTSITPALAAQLQQLQPVGYHHQSFILTPQPPPPHHQHSHSQHLLPLQASFTLAPQAIAPSLVPIPSTATGITPVPSPSPSLLAASTITAAQSSSPSPAAVGSIVTATSVPLIQPSSLSSSSSSSMIMAVAPSSGAALTPAAAVSMRVDAASPVGSSIAASSTGSSSSSSSSLLLPSPPRTLAFSPMTPVAAALPIRIPTAPPMESKLDPIHDSKDENSNDDDDDNDEKRNGVLPPPPPASASNTPVAQRGSFNATNVNGNGLLPPSNTNSSSSSN
jgi:hypothetical protein